MASVIMNSGVLNTSAGAPPMPVNMPVAMANLDVGHGGTHREPNGGESGRVAVAWLKWRLQGDDTAGNVRAGPSCGLCTDARWKLEKPRLPEEACVR
jgi:hypothetical protein